MALAGSAASLIAASADAETFPMPPAGDDVIGGLRWVSARPGDTLVDIAARYDVGYEEIRSANPGVDSWLPREGTRVRLPTRYVLPAGPRQGIVLNIAEMRLYYFPKPRRDQPAVVMTFPVSIGRGDWSTPVVNTRVRSKVVDPVWTPPDSVRAEHAADGEVLPEKVLPGEDNPLGKHALRLDLPSYLIHGTNKVFGIGMQVTHGCVRLYPQDIETLYREVPVGTAVRIVNQPYKAGWRNGVLFLEVHPWLEGTPVDVQRNRSPLVQVLVEATRERANYGINWAEVEVIDWEKSGVPMPVNSKSSPDAGAMGR